MKYRIERMYLLWRWSIENGHVGIALTKRNARRAAEAYITTHTGNLDRVA